MHHCKRTCSLPFVNPACPSSVAPSTFCQDYRTVASLAALYTAPLSSLFAFRDHCRSRTTRKRFFLTIQPLKGDGAFDFLAEEERAAKYAKGRLDPGFNQQQLAVLEDTELVVGQRDAEINNIGELPTRPVWNASA